MNCDSCGRDDPRYHYTILRGNRIVMVHICEECRLKNGVEQSRRARDNEEESTKDLLNSLLYSRKEEEGALHERRCEVCGTTYRDVVSESLMGCANCYQVFSDILFDEEGSEEKNFQIHYLKTLKRELNEAVRMEMFEKAAEIRDKLKHFENSGYFE